MTSPRCNASAWSDDERRPVLVVLVAGTVALALYYALPAERREWFYNAAAGALLVVATVGVLRHRSTARTAWFVLVAGQAAALVGDSLWTYYEQVAGVGTQQTIVPDLCYLASYPILTLGVVLVLRRSVRGGGLAALLDGGVVTISVGLAVWVYLVSPAVGQDELTGAERLIAAAYPLADLLIVAVLVVFALRVRRASGSLTLLGAALCANLVSDVFFLVGTMQGTYRTGGPSDAGWLLAYVLLAAAPFWPEHGAPYQPGSSRLSAPRLVMLGLAALLIPAMVTWEYVQGGTVPAVGAAWVAAVLFMLAMGRVALFNRSLDTAKAAVETTKAQLITVVEDLQQSQRERRLLLDRVNRAAEGQRTQLAAELHDRPIQHLTALSFRLQRVARLLDRDDRDGARRLVEEIGLALSSQVEELRTLMSDLRPPMLDERGLLDALRAASPAADPVADDTGPAVTGPAVTIDGDPGELRDEVETHLYRVVGEALANVRRHARASHARVQFDRSSDGLRIRIDDDGVGFDVTTIRDLVGDGHFGLVSMRERIEILGGTATYRSSPGAGTTLVFELPRHALDGATVPVPT